MTALQQPSTAVDLDALAQYTYEHRLNRRAAALLHHLLDEAALTPGLIEPFEAGTCALEFRLGSRAGRRTMVRWLGDLVDAGAIEYSPRTGKTPGRVLVLVYDELTLGPVLGRDIAPQDFLERDLGRDGARSHRAPSRLERDLGRDIAPQDPPLERDFAGRKEEDLPALQELQAGRERDRAPKPQSSNGNDWTDNDLEDLVAPLTRLCNTASPPLPGILHRPGLVAALSRYSRAQVEQAIRVMCTRIRSGERIRTPFGLLIRKAKAGAPEYFAAPMLSSTAAAVSHHDPAGVGVGDDIEFRPPPGPLGDKLVGVRARR